MTERQRAPEKPGQNPSGAAKKAEREARSARALRENLKRRKAQMKVRETLPDDTK